MSLRRIRIPRALGCIALAGLFAAVLAAGCARARKPLPEGVLLVTQEAASAWSRNFNPLTTAAAPRWPTQAGSYEPLFVFNSIQNRTIPWLATRYAWRDGGLTLRVNTRTGVRWSDGRPFSARDVAFTFELVHRFPGLDRRAVWAFLAAVKQVDDTTVDLRFQRRFVPGFDEVAAQNIVPEHIWSKIKEPVSFTNENPVATGPFTEVRVFQAQVYEIGRNPYYWQPGKPAFEAIRCPAYPGNDRANLALAFDELDWAGNFVPAIDRVFVQRSPKTHAYWFPLTGTCVFLYANTTKAPYSDVHVRKAISMAIDRQLLVDVALYRYSRPSDVTGMSDALASWRDSTAIAAGDWVKYDRVRAAALLDSAGLRRGPDGIRLLADGKPWKTEILVVAGWSDWVRACQVMARSLRELGIDASVKTYDFGAWFQHVQKGEFDLSLGWTFEGPTPYPFYRQLMASATVKPVGETSVGNWHRYGSPAADRLLNAFEAEADSAKQRDLSAQLQRLFAAEAPAIPLYPNPSWAEYNLSRFEGFPSAQDPYCDPSTNKLDRGEVLLVLTTIRPKRRSS